MASRTLFPPVVNSFEPAFVVGGSSVLRVYFSYPAFSSVSDFSNITLHAAITRKDDVKVVKDDNYTNWTGGRIRSNGIIMNLVPQSAGFEKNNYYYVEILNEDLKSSVNINGKSFNGWIPGWEYKVQLRFATVPYTAQSGVPANYIQKNSDSFSEWSSFCSTKAIGRMVLDLPMFNFKTNENENKYVIQSNYYVDTINFIGTLKNEIESSNEYYQSYRVQLYTLGNDIDTDISILEPDEDSGDIYVSEISKTIVQYNFRTNFEYDKNYAIAFSFVTDNGYKLKEPYIFRFRYLNNTITLDDYILGIATIDYDPEHCFIDNYNAENESHAHYIYSTSIGKEEDEGRIAIKFYSKPKFVSETPHKFIGNLCLKRTDQTSNFEQWDDIKIFNYTEEIELKKQPIFYDYTIQSGIWYQYGVQVIYSDGSRSELVKMKTDGTDDKPIEPVVVQRLFDHAYLLGQNDIQLKIPFDFDLSNYKINILENKVETIGSKYPFISRNAAVNYRTISIGGIVSYWMDENKTFLKNGKEDLYYYGEPHLPNPINIIDKYENFNIERRIGMRDFTYEKDFREAVLKFFLDGKPKLFKSPSEGNMIVRLMETSCSPKKELGRLIYSISSTAHEIADATMKNYLMYGFYNPGTYTTQATVTETKLGQLQGTFAIGNNNKTQNLIDLIYEKYDAGYDENIDGKTRKLKYIDHVEIIIDEDKPIAVKNSQGIDVIGYNIELVSNGVSNIVTIASPMDKYNFGSDVKIYCEQGLGNSSELYLIGDENGAIDSISATINFYYTYAEEPAKMQRKIKEQKIVGIGQVFENVSPDLDQNILEDVFTKNFIQTKEFVRQLDKIYKITIEAEPYTHFKIKMGTDDFVEFEINQTGILNLSQAMDVRSIIYAGKRYLQTIYDESTLSDEVIIQPVTLRDVFGEEYILSPSTDVSITYFYEVTEETLGY